MIYAFTIFIQKMSLKKKVAGFHHRVSVLDAFTTGLESLHNRSSKLHQKGRMLSKNTSDESQASNKHVGRFDTLNFDPDITYNSSLGTSTSIDYANEERRQSTQLHQKSFVISTIKNIALAIAIGALVAIIAAIAFTLYHRISESEDNSSTEIAHILPDTATYPTSNSTMRKRYKGILGIKISFCMITKVYIITISPRHLSQ